MKLLLALLLTTLSFTTTLLASNYPPDYPTSLAKEAKTVGPFWIEKKLVSQYRKSETLTIAYKGELLDRHSAESIVITIKLNGIQRAFKMTRGQYNDAFVVLHASYFNCRMGRAGWECQQPSKSENDLFFWAANQYGQDNAWDLEIWAQVDGEFDSNFGNNYKTRLSALR